MGAFLLSLVVIVAIGFGASAWLETYERSVEQTFVGSGVQIDGAAQAPSAPKR